MHINQTKILDGRVIREKNTPILIERIKTLGFVPTLAIIQIGNRPDSTSYIRSKKIFAKKIGVKEIHIELPESVEESEILTQIDKCNTDDSIQGIIVQLPVPENINRDRIINAIKPEKDVDALTETSMKRWQEGKGIMPATARGIKEMFDYYQISLKDKKVTVIGRSQLVGTPIAYMCRNKGAIVTVCHSKTVDLIMETKPADIVIVTVGKPYLIDDRHIDKGQIIIDVGITKREDGTLVGDVNFERVKNIVSAISPVPGGVGQMTVFALFENLIDLCSSTH